MRTFGGCKRHGDVDQRFTGKLILDGIERILVRAVGDAENHEIGFGGGFGVAQADQEVIAEALVQRFGVVGSASRITRADDDPVTMQRPAHRQAGTFFAGTADDGNRYDSRNYL